VKERWKIIGCVALIGLLGADIGLQTARIFAPTMSFWESRNDLINPQDGQRPQSNDPDYGNYAVGIATLITLIVQAVIFGKQARLMRRMTAIYRHQARTMGGQLEAATTAANTAAEQVELARKEFLASHRPQIVVHSIRLLPSNRGAPINERPLVAQFAIVNAGTSDCRIMGSAVYLAYSRPIDKPLLPNLHRNGVVIPQRFAVGATNNCIEVTAIISDDEEFEAGFVGDAYNTGGNDAAVSGHVLYINAWIAYCELSRSKRTTYFRRMYNPRVNRFVPTGDPEDEKTY
jgi:hypothetical protein